MARMTELSRSGSPGASPLWPARANYLDFRDVFLRFLKSLKFVGSR